MHNLIELKDLKHELGVCLCGTVYRNEALVIDNLVIKKILGH